MSSRSLPRDCVTPWSSRKPRLARRASLIIIRADQRCLQQAESSYYPDHIWPHLDRLPPRGDRSTLVDGFPKGRGPQKATGRFKRDWDWWVAYLINCAFLSVIEAIGFFVLIGSISFAFFGVLGSRE